MDKWFTVDRIDGDTYIISEYRPIGIISEGINIFRISMPMKRNWGGCRADEGCFSGIEGERETASWERNF